MNARGSTPLRLVRLDAPQELRRHFKAAARLRILFRGVSDIELTAFTFEVVDGVAPITMSQPERCNPFDGHFAAEF